MSLQSKHQQLAQKLMQRQNTVGVQATPLEAQGDTAPLSAAQMRLWLLHAMNPNDTAYNLVSCFSLKGNLNTRALRLALDALETRHCMLRTQLRVTPEGEPYQHIQPPQGAPFYQQELTGDDAAVATFINQRANIAFNFQDGPLWRIDLVKLSANEHILVINVHHVAFDGWSLGVFVKELFTYYTEAVFTGTVVPPRLQVQYVDYAVWSRKHLAAGDRAAVQGQFWREYLRNTPGILALRHDLPRPKSGSSKGVTKTLLLSQHLFEALCQLGRPAGITPFNIFLGLLNVLLYRYTGQTHIVVGTPVAGRGEAVFQPLIGLLANTLPFANEVDPQEHFLAFIERVAQQSAKVMHHSDLPFDAIVEAVRPERSQGVNPIFQVFYAYQTKVDPGLVAGLDVLYQIRDFGTCKFDLSLDVMEGPEGPTCIFEYNAELFLPATIERMMGHFHQLAKSLADNPRQPIGRVNMLTEAEQTSLVPPATRYLPPEFVLTFAERFAQIAEKYTTREALVDGAQRLTYKALAARVNAVAYGLRRAGVDIHQTVGVCLPRTWELIVALLAVNTLGCTFVALDSEQPAQRLRFIVDNSDITRVIVSGENTQAGICGAAFDHCSRLSMAALLDLPSIDTPMLQRVSRYCKAYGIYTSGTTGTPKGVAVSHLNWMNALYGWQQKYQLGSEIFNHLQLAHLGFDVFCGDLIRALGTGGKLVLCPKTLFAQPPALLRLMQQEQIEFAEFVPAVFRPLADYMAAQQQELPAIKLLVVASDSWYMSEYHAFLKLLPPTARLVNSYGLVECTIDSTWFGLTQSSAALADAAAQDYMVPIGEDFPNVATYVLNEQQTLQPVGVAGEIYIGGLGVVDGYIGLEALTRERFCPNPFVYGETLYRTGDLGFRREDGALILLGRGDQQVKIRGQRLELGEIEACILRFPSIAKAVVTVQKNAAQQSTLVAFVVCDLPELNKAALKGFLLQHLPNFMVPEHYQAVTDFPLNQNGKVDRKQLPLLDFAEQSCEQVYQAPATPTEQQLAAIWAVLFKREQIGREDDFFALGGHSLTALNLLAQLQKRFGVNLSVPDVFNYSSLAGLAARVDNHLAATSTCQSDVPDPPVEGLVPQPHLRFEPYPMTPIQQAYWLGRGDLFEFGNISAHSYDEFEVTTLDVDALEDAWNKVIQQHDMLRTLVLPSGQLQTLARVPRYAIAREDFSHLGAAERDAALARVRDAMSHQIIDVTRWPAFDLRLSHLPAGRMRLHFSTDAIMFDVRSFLIVLGDLLAFYQDRNRPVVIPEVSFRDYVLAEYAIVNSAAQRKAQAYWQAKIPLLPPAPQLPLSKNPRDVKQPRFQRLHRRWPATCWSRLKTLATQIGVTPTGLLLGAFADILTDYSREPAFSLNLTFLSRRPLHPRIDEVVGEFTSLTLLAVDNSPATGRTDFKSRVRKIQEDLWRDLEHQDVSGVEVLRELSKLSGDNYRAKMPVVFTSALVMDVPDQIAGIEIQPLHTLSITQTSQVWLDCGVWEEGGDLLCNWDLVPEMYPEGFAQAMFSAFDTLLQGLAELPEVGLTAGVGGCGQERWPAPQLPEYLGSPDDTLIHLFLQRVAIAPDALALVAESTSLNYRQLAELSYGLSQALRARSPAPLNGSLVAVIMHKGWEPIAACLGIMLAGGAYLPIDPELPAARMRYLIQQCDVNLVVTQPELSDELPDLGPVQLVRVDLNIARPLDAHLGNHLPSADDLAYVIFTSGSTGTPKGVVINHRGATNTVLDCNHRYGISACDRVLAISALNFDLSVYDIFGLLAAGGAIVVPAHERRLDPRHWLNLIQEHKVSLWNTVPALLALLINYCEQSQLTLPHVQQAWVSGDWVPLNLYERLQAINPTVALISMGGATEASIWSISYPVDKVDPSWHSIPYGRAMANQQMYVLNSELKICPDWVTGDLYIGGIGLAQGYWRDHDKTAATFIFHPVSGMRLYKTGDLGRRLPDGNIEFLGRADFQTKVQGFRIELGEIEQALINHPAVLDAIVCAQGERHGDKVLIAYVIPQPDSGPLNSLLLQQALSEKLPDYMVPRRYVALAEFPLSANGKVDRQKLPQPASVLATRGNTYRPPETPLQEGLVKIWQQLLAHAAIGLDDSFIQLGGDSMKAVAMLGLIQSQLGLEVSLRQIMTSKSIAELATQLAASQPVTPTPGLLPSSAHP